MEPAHVTQASGGRRPPDPIRGLTPPAHRTALALLLLVTTAALAQPADDAGDGIPFQGRPTDVPFSGASGKFTVSLRAAPQQLHEGEALTLTLTVTAIGPVRQPPRRIDLRELPEFADRFYIEDGPSVADRRPAPERWEFAYRLKPKSAAVTEVPELPFVFYDPGLRSFQRDYAGPLSLTVRPAEPYAVARPTPTWAAELARGDVLARRRPWTPPGPTVVALALIVPPLACGAWYMAWRRLYPDAARLARRRRGRAARAALAQLRRARRLPADRQAAAAVAALAGYLRQRLDLPVAEPTPAEAAAHLGRAGCPAAATEAERFLRACDRARFGPGRSANGFAPARDAERLVLAVEAEACPPHSS